MSDVGLRSIEPLVGALQQLYRWVGAISVASGRTAADWRMCGDSKYKFMETNLQKSRESFKRKIPETERDLEMLRHLIAKQDEGEALRTRFNLSDNVYAHATVDPAVGKVCIWLGVRCRRLSRSPP